MIGDSVPHPARQAERTGTTVVIAGFKAIMREWLPDAVLEPAKIVRVQFDVYVHRQDDPINRCPMAYPGSPGC